MFIGGFPSEMMIALAIQTGQVGGLTVYFWVWIGLMLFTALLCIFVQLKHRKANMESYKYREKFEVIRYLDFKTMRNRYTQ